MIRRAEISDIHTILRLAHEVHSRSIYKNIKTDDTIFKKTCAFSIGSRQMFLWVSERAGEVNGFLLGGVDEIGIPGVKGRQASDILFYVREGGEGLALARRFIQWGWKQPNVEMVGLANSSGIETERVNRMIKRMGMNPTVTVFLQFREDKRDV